MADIHDLGAFSTLELVWKSYPSGGCPGDYVTIGAEVVYWNQYRNIWGEAGDVVSTPEEQHVEGNLTVYGNLTVGGKTTGDAAEFNSLKVDNIEVTNSPFADKAHNHDGVYSKTDHNHDSLYAPKSHRHAASDIDGFSGSGSVGSVDIVSEDSVTVPSNTNVFSSKRTLKEITENNDVLGELFLRKDIPDTAAELITFLKGLVSKGDIEVGDFVSGMLTGKGARIDALGNIEAESVTIRSSLKVLELLINRLSAIESDYVFTEADTVESVENLGENTYRLTLRKKWDGYFTAQKENNVLFGVINTLASGSGGEFYTSWSRVLNVNTTDNTITVVLYPDSEVPDGVNHPPVKGMVIARKGNSDSPLDGSHNVRQDFWSLSSSEGRIQFLQKVAKPILEEYYYTLSIGKLPQLDKFKGLPISEDDTAVYAKNLIAENFFTIDPQGNVQTQEVFRGTWSAEVAASDKPYRRIVNDVVSDAGTVSHVLAVHTVYHNGLKWACLIDNTLLEPRWNSPAWQFLEGNDEYEVEFYSSAGSAFFGGIVDTILEARVRYGKQDITDEVMSLAATDVQWTRNSGNIPDDNAWIPFHDGMPKNSLRLVTDDMGVNWRTSRQTSFTVTFFLPIGDILVTESILFNI